MKSNCIFETRCLSSLSKVFPDEELKSNPFYKATALLNEVYSFQIAYRYHGELLKGIKVEVESDFLNPVLVRKVGLVPSELPCFLDHDEHILRSKPGLYPDPLYEIEEDGIIAYPNQWRSIWFTVHISEEDKPGLHNIHVIFKSATGDELADELFQIEVIPAVLPEQKLIHTEWLHIDCLAVQYNVEIFSEKHWELIAQYVKNAVKHGVNMILTPIFTPPLDTAVGGERPTVQLVDVEQHGNKYHFSFEKLNRWIEMCSNCGIKYFEFSHLFTQWGAYYAPKIIARVNGVEKKIFGWETDASGEEYKNFLSQFLPKLVQYIRDNNLEKRVFFHISDEPKMEHLESYKKASDIIYQYLLEYPIIDALSEYTFYEKGLVKCPIPSIDRIEPFLSNKVPNLWTYYCSTQKKQVSNRFFNYPSVRNRIIGFQLYKFDIKGFLHWGYNFWFSQYSRKPVDPFRITDADSSFPSGDAFLVYPGKEGPIESIRLEVFNEALQDLRALQLLENMIGRKQGIDLLDDGLNEPLTFKKYPCNDDWLLGKRDCINRKIAEFINFNLGH